MALQSKIIVAVYVRHKATCPKAKHGEFYHACECPKWLRYSFNGRQHRVSAETRSWGVAEEKANEKQQQLDAGTDTALQHSSEKPNLKRAIEIFIASKRNQELSDAVIGKYERELDRLEQFMSMRSRFFPADIRLEDLEEFRVDWKRVYESSLTRQKVQERLRSFLRYCYEAGWITRVPKLSAIKVDEPPTLPLTDIEYTKLLSQCATKFIPDKAKKVHALVRVMRHSGLAIRDAVTIERNEIIWDKKKAVHRIVTSRQKTGVHVSIPLPPDVSKELLEVLNGNERYVFWNRGAIGGNVSEKRGVNGQETTVVGMYQTALRDLFKAAGVYLEDQHMVSHRLRDTFAVSMLQNGVPMEEVSKMLGNSFKVCEKHYAKWEQSRQDRLDSLVVGTWKEQ